MMLMMVISLVRTRVLIDTWWNVNSSSHVHRLNAQHSFNRYMVECE